jgi:hypothetical protein
MHDSATAHAINRSILALRDLVTNIPISGLRARQASLVWFLLVEHADTESLSQ